MDKRRETTTRMRVVQVSRIVGNLLQQTGKHKLFYRKMEMFFNPLNKKSFFLSVSSA